MSYKLKELDDRIPQLSSDETEIVSSFGGEPAPELTEAKFFQLLENDRRKAQELENENQNLINQEARATRREKEALEKIKRRYKRVPEKERILEMTQLVLELSSLLDEYREAATREICKLLIEALKAQYTKEQLDEEKMVEVDENWQPVPHQDKDFSDAAIQRIATAFNDGIISHDQLRYQLTDWERNRLRIVQSFQVACFPDGKLYKPDTVRKIAEKIQGFLSNQISQRPERLNTYILTSLDYCEGTIWESLEKEFRQFLRSLGYTVLSRRSSCMIFQSDILPPHLEAQTTPPAAEHKEDTSNSEQLTNDLHPDSAG